MYLAAGLFSGVVGVLLWWDTFSNEDVQMGIESGLSLEKIVQVECDWDGRIHSEG